MNTQPKQNSSAHFEKLSPLLMHSMVGRSKEPDMMLSKPNSSEDDVLVSMNHAKLKIWSVRKKEEEREEWKE